MTDIDYFNIIDLVGDPHAKKSEFDLKGNYEMAKVILSKHNALLP